MFTNPHIQSLVKTFSGNVISTVLLRPFRLPGVCRFLQNSAFLEDPAQVRQHFGESDQHKILVRLYLFVVVIKNRTKSKEERCKDVENGQVESNTLQKKEMIGLKQNGIKTFSRVRKQWEGSENDECTICLDQFKIGDNLIHLQCDHKFHSCCLVPWLENYPYCPCCRMEIVT